MATDTLDMSVSEIDDQGFSQPPKAALLLIIGEPLSEDHRTLILGEITKGFKSWDCAATGIDINDELARIANRASLGEEGPNGERIIRHRSENVAVEILVNPQAQTVRKCLKGFLKVASQVKFLLYAGHAFQGSGAWVLQDDVFTFTNFVHIFKDTDVENALKQQEHVDLTFYSFADGDWTSSITKQEFSKIMKIGLNPPEKLQSVHGVLQFTAYVGSFVKTQTLNSLLSSSDVVGNIRFNKPTLYIFPGCQGDSALFGISGFSLLVNGGYNRKACFWDFTRHLDRIDAVLLTHLGTDNLFGLSSVLERKSSENVHPEIGFLYLNSSEKTRSSPVASTEDLKSKDPSLLINLAEEGNRIIEFSKKLGQHPHQCSRSVSGNHQEPVSLYHKVGHGSLDMFVLNPVQDSKELKEFYQQWNKQVSNFGANQHFPLPNMLSICALLVWRPSSATEKITRIFFSGNAPQHKIIEGLEKIKHLDFLKHPSCCQKDLSHPGKKTPAKSSARPRLSDVKSEVPRKATPVKAEVPKAERSRPLSSTLSRGNKVTKEDTNKKTAKAKEVKKKDDEKEKSDKAKSSTSSSPSKSSVKSAGSPKKSPSSPMKAISQAASEPFPASPEVKSGERKLLDISEPKETLTNHMNGDVLTMETQALVDDTPTVQPERSDALQAEVRESHSPAPLPDPVEYEQEPENAFSDSVPVEAQPPFDKQKLAELGIYDDDYDDVEEANGSYPTEPAGGSPETTPEEPEEIEQPQPLPEPVEVESPFDSEPDLIQETTPQKEALPEIEPAVSEPDIVASVEEPITNSEELLLVVPEQASDRVHPAEDIPLSPDSTGEEHFSFSKSTEKIIEEPPQFTHEPDVVACMHGQSPIEQNIQYGITDDNGRHMGGIREEEEEEEVESGRDSQEKQFAEVVSREDSLEPTIEGPDTDEKYPEPIEAEGNKPVKASSKPKEESKESLEASPDLEEQLGERHTFEEKPKFGKITMEKAGIYGEEEEQVAGGQEECDSDANVFKQDVNIEDEERPQASEEVGISSFEKENHPRMMVDERYADYDHYLGSRASESLEKDKDETESVQESPESEEFQRDSIERDQECNIPEAFEKDETPTPRESLSLVDNLTGDYSAATESAVASGMQDGGSNVRDDTDSIDGGTPDDDKDIDESFQQECEHSAVVNCSAEQELMAGDEPLAEEKGVQALTNPFETCDQQAQNPFISIDNANMPQIQVSTLNPLSDPFEPENRQQTDTFDPLSEWGQPMGLPSPPPPEDSKSSSPTLKVNRMQKNGTKAADGAKKTACTNKQNSKTSNGPSSKGLDPKAPKTSRPASAADKKTEPKKPSVSTAATKASARQRPTTAPTKAEPLKTARSAAARRPVSATSRSSPTAQRSPPLPPMTPFYVDLTYIPNHGDPGYSDVEFFKRIRARYYVLSALSPNPQILNALLEAKKVWDDKDLEVTVIPTYDNETLRHWMGLHKEDLGQLKIDVAPSASRCTIQLQDHETSCSAYRLEF